jgi:hypothetical protein
MPDRPGTHRLAAWLLIVVALLAAAVGVGVRFFLTDMAEITGRPWDELTNWWNPAALGAVCLVALLVGVRLAVAPRGAKAPSVAKRAAPTGNNLVAIETTEAPEPEATPPEEPLRQPEAPAYWPADQAVGVAWARASDAVPGATVPDVAPEPPAADGAA